MASDRLGATFASACVFGHHNNRQSTDFNNVQHPIIDVQKTFSSYNRISESQNSMLTPSFSPNHYSCILNRSSTSEPPVVRSVPPRHLPQDRSSWSFPQESR